MNLEEIFALQSKPKEVFSVSKILRDRIEAKAVKDGKQAEVTKYRASGIGACARKIYYGKKGFTEKIGYVSKFTLDQGNALHDLIQEYLGDFLTSLEVRVFFSDDLSGSYDGTFMVGNEERLLELKTMNPEAFERMVLYGSIYPKYKVQANVYMEAKGLTKCHFVFINKGNMLSTAFKEAHGNEYDPLFFEVVYYRDQKIVDEIHAKIELLNYHVDNDIVPAYRKVSECSYCGFRDLCEQANKDDKAAAKLAKVKVPKEPKQKKT